MFWFRKDLRIQDNEGLTAAIKQASATEGKKLYAIYDFNTDLVSQLEGIREHSLYESIRSLDISLNGNLGLIHSNKTKTFPKQIVDVAIQNEVSIIFAMESFDPEGRKLQEEVRSALMAKGIELRLVGSAYAVLPGVVSKPDGGNYRVYSPFYRAWVQLVRDKAFTADLNLVKLIKISNSQDLPKPQKQSPIKVIAGEAFALRTLARFKERGLDSYDEDRNRADLSGTSHLSHALAHGEIHPRTILRELGDSPAHEVFRKEIAWREFYADVLFHYPNTLMDYYEPKYKKLRYDTGAKAQTRFEAWCKGETGFPMVDAGMRQLLAEGWMHNRVRMIVASFLVKDLHLEWTLGAEHFEKHLSDFDPASNSHGWQWTAGCGTDASPYYRIFNPILQGLKFDPNGDYVRKYIPELSHLGGASAHEPWEIFDGYANGYPIQIVDHSTERNGSLARLEEIKQKV